MGYQKGFKNEKFEIQKTSLFAESWNVAWRKGSPGGILSDKETPFNIIENAYRYWAADPFVFEKNGCVYIFAELYDYVLCRGVLGYCMLRESKKSKWTPIIIEKTQLSYPCIIEDGDKIYLMPESEEEKELVLYEVIEFPLKWKKKYVLRKNVSFADTTPIKWDETKWAITHNIKDPYHPKLMLIDLKKYMMMH